MSNGAKASGNSLAETLVDTWAAQGRDGFLLSDPASADIPTREFVDPSTGVPFRFRWMPHRELRGDVAELERRGILNADRNEDRLFRDSRDPSGRHCFLCAENIAECHPLEALVPLRLAGRAYFAGANFAWIEVNHFTVMSADHTDQVYSRHAMEAVVDLHEQCERRFRVLYNGQGAGASIPWHLHFQITTVPVPIEQIENHREKDYPTAVQRFDLHDDGLNRAHAVADEWQDSDPGNHSVNLLVATPNGRTHIFVFARDRRRSSAVGKGLVGGFEVAGDFVLSAPSEIATFDNASAESARGILAQVRPPD